MLSVSDDGCGISKRDLELAATRHATSKLTCIDDFAGLETFGFRGEALASMSTVSRLTISSRTADSKVAYTQTYRNGSPTTKKPKPGARKRGTTIKVQDLFYNVPHRKNTYSKRESDEYNRILTVVQHYALHYPHAGFVCQRTRSDANKTLLVDLNTSQLPHVKELINTMSSSSSSSSAATSSGPPQPASTLASPPSSLSLSPSQTQPSPDEQLDEKRKDQAIKATKQVMSHIFHSDLEKYVSCFDCDEKGKRNVDFTYKAQVYYTSPTYNAKTSKLVVFLNNRLVDLPPLKRALDDVYADFTQTKPILVVNVSVPGSQVDVNVHPTKRQVALVYQDELCSAIAKRLRQSLEDQGQSFETQSVTPKVIKNPYAKKKRKNPAEIVNPYNPSKQTRRNDASMVRTSGATPVGAIEPFLVLTQPTAQQQNSLPQASNVDNEGDKFSTPGPIKFTHLSACPLSKPIDLTQPGAFALQCTCGSAGTTTTPGVMLIQRPIVRPKRIIPTKCSYLSIASLRRRVNKKSSKDLMQQLREAYFVGLLSHQRSLVQCGETLVMINHLELAKDLFYQLALARFGGGAVVAQLGQKPPGGVDDCAGSFGIDIQQIIAQTLQLEDDLILGMERQQQQQQHHGFDDDRDNNSNNNRDILHSLRQRNLLTVSETNEKLSQQAAACLVDHADMLREYFSIRIETFRVTSNDNHGSNPDDDDDNDDDMNDIAGIRRNDRSTKRHFLTGLPVLLDGHCPEPHGLGIFLLRLATQVDWAEERPCFHGICQELGNYYAMLPSNTNDNNTYNDDDDDKNTVDSSALELYVQHTLFPALSYILLPYESLKSDNNFVALTKLSTLYKVFERC